MPNATGTKDVVNAKVLWALGSKRAEPAGNTRPLVWRLVRAARPVEREGWDRVWIPVEPEDIPDQETLEGWVFDSGCEAVDGCWVEPDGTCPHGSPSWLLVLGLI